jgi:hypothetical protein
MPFMLRESRQESFFLVCPTYFEGIMDGGATTVVSFEKSLRILEFW